MIVRVDDEVNAIMMRALSNYDLLNARCTIHPTSRAFLHSFVQSQVARLTLQNKRLAMETAFETAV